MNITYILLSFLTITKINVALSPRPSPAFIEDTHHFVKFTSEYICLSAIATSPIPASCVAIKN